MFDSNMIQEGMMVHAKGSGVMDGVEGVHVGTVDRIEGNFIKLKRSDSWDGRHHFVPLRLVDRVEENAVHLLVTDEEFQSSVIDELPSDEQNIAG